MSDFRFEGDVLIKYEGNDSHVVIPRGVTEIGASAFENDYETMSGEQLAICDRYGPDAYDRTYLRSVVIPEGVTEIGEGAFYNCSSLTIRGGAGSCAERYARGNKIPFETL